MLAGIAIDAASTSSEKPPAAPIAAMATENGPPASAPLIPTIPTKKKANAPKPSTAASQNVRIAIMVTPVGLLTIFNTSFTSCHAQTGVTPLPPNAVERCDFQPSCVVKREL